MSSLKVNGADQLHFRLLAERTDYLLPYPTQSTVDNYLLRLRKLFEPAPHRPRHIITVRGVGYRLSAGDEIVLDRVVLEVA